MNRKIAENRVVVTAVACLLSGVLFEAQQPPPGSTEDSPKALQGAAMADMESSALTFTSGAFTPPDGLDARMEAQIPALLAANRSFVYGFVSLDGFLTDSIRDELARFGVTLLGPHDAMYKARLPANATVLLQIVTHMPSVDWIGYSMPGQKIARDLAASMTPDARRGDRATVPSTDWSADWSADRPLVVNLFDDDPTGAFRAAIERTGAVVQSWDSDLRAYIVLASPREVQELIGYDFVLFVEPMREMTVQHDQSMAVIGADYIRGGGSNRYSGRGIKLGILDSGFASHQDFYQRTICGRDATGSRWGVWDDQETGHGTHVLGTIAGRGHYRAQYRGVATSVGQAEPILAVKVFDGREGVAGAARTGMDLLSNPRTEWTCRGPAAQTNTIPHIVNFSGGGEPYPSRETVHTGTDELSRKVDAKVFYHGQLYVISAGNDGEERRQTITIPGVAKNALTVGSVFDYGFQQIGDRVPHSAIGVTGDRRMKPNLVAPGANVRSLDANDRTGYRTMSGTSMAAPHVAGLAATLMEHHPRLKRRPALTRALLMATSIFHGTDEIPRLPGWSDHRDEYGMGRVSSFLSHWDDWRPGGWGRYWKWGTIGRTGTYEAQDINVPAGSRRLVVVATWDEPPASAGAARAVLYDLDLHLDHRGDCGRGNCGEWRSDSTTDNVEFIVIDDPPAGSYKTKLYAYRGSSWQRLPFGMIAMVIRGDPTPSMSLTTSVSPAVPVVGREFTIRTRVSTPAYVASGVHIALTTGSSGARYRGARTRRPDGVNATFLNNEFTLGNVVRGWPREVLWRFVPSRSGRQTYTFRAWSENGGTKWRTVTVDVIGYRVGSSGNCRNAGRDVEGGGGRWRWGCTELHRCR